MKVIIKSNSNNKFICLNVIFKTAEEFIKVKSFYLEILSMVFLRKSLNLITISPQEYSFGYDFKNNNLRKLNNKYFLISNITNCDLDLLNMVVSSEEFRRSLLYIVEGAADLPDDELLSITGPPISSSIISTKEVIICEDDGDSLYFYNSVIKTSELEIIARQMGLDPEVVNIN